MIKRIPIQAKTNDYLTKLRLLSSILSLSLIAACGGSGAGDGAAEPIDTNAGMAVEPVVGVWNLPEDWSGEDNDEAVLLIRNPDSSGVAEVVIYNFDDVTTGQGQNCFFNDGEGEISQSLINSELFLDISAFPDAIVSLNAAGNLVIVFTVGASTATNRETDTLIAEQLGITETDITPRCES